VGCFLLLQLFLTNVTVTKIDDPHQCIAGGVKRNGKRGEGEGRLQASGFGLQGSGFGVGGDSPRRQLRRAAGLVPAEIGQTPTRGPRLSWPTADSREPTAFRKRCFLAEFCREKAEIDFHATKLSRRGSEGGPFLGQLRRIKGQKGAEYCQSIAGDHFETPWFSRGV
jgi:hypothetical protein